MKRKLLVIGSLIGIFIIFVLVRFFVFDSPNESGRIKILSSPTAGVFIDNEPLGKTPFETRIAPGEHSIKLIPEGEGTQTVSWEGKVQVYEHTLTFISRELGTSELTSAGEVLTVIGMKEKSKGSVGSVSIVTEPAGAIIFLDNDEKGIAPLELRDVPAGTHELAVYLPGFFRRSQKIQVASGYTVQALFKLGLDKTHKTLEDELTARAEEASAEAALTGTPTPEPSTTSSKSTLTIKETGEGYLNVRDEPSRSGTQIDQVLPGEKYSYSDEKNGWYKITLKDKSEGWVSGSYVQKNE